MIIDLGCGQRVKEDATHVVDLVKPANIRGAKYIRHDLNKYPYPLENDVADKIYADNVYEHLGISLYDFLIECHRILKSDGILVFKIPNAWCINKRLSFLIGRSLPSYHPQHIQYPKASFTRKVMKHIGFKDISRCSDLFSRQIELRGRKG